MLKHKILVLLILLLPFCLSGQTEDLVKNFKNPPAEYSLLPFWSWNGTLKPDKLKWQIDQMMEKGIQGAFLHARSGLDESETPYFSEGFWQAMDTVMNYAARKGFLACLYDEDKWPSGSAGGRTVAANPEEFVKKVLFFSKMEVVGPQTIRLNLQYKPLFIFAGRTTENGQYDSSGQINLSALAGQEWKVPSGRWTIISFEMTKDPNEQIDYLDSAAVAQFIKITHEEYYRRYGKYFGKTIPGIFFDEIYANNSKMGNNIFWTDDFLSQFRTIKGYELSDILPLLVLNDPEKSTKARTDYFDVVRQLYIRAWFKQYAGWCEKHSIWATGHTTEKMLHYKRQSDYFSTMGQLQVPGADNEEFRYGFPRMVDWYNLRQIHSIANLYNRKRNMAESLGSGGYGIAPEEYRYGLSMLGVYGINMFIPHLFHYTMNTPESQTDWPPSWFFQNPYWKYFKPLAEFGHRIAYLNSQGREVCDVAIFYPLNDLWAGGYSEPVDDSFYKSVQQTLLDNHITYNVIDPASLENAQIGDGHILAGKGKYRVLILPAVQILSPAVLKKIEDFLASGGTLISLKSLPSRSSSGSGDDEQVRSKMKQWFGFYPENLRQEEYFQWNPAQTEHFTTQTISSGGKAIFTRFAGELPRIINQQIVPDVVVAGENAKFLKVSHREVEEKNIFLLVNDRNTPGNYNISLRSFGTPSIWDPQNGEIRAFENYQIDGQRLELNLNFAPRQSFFLVIEPGQPVTAAGILESTTLSDVQVSKNQQTMKVEGWSVAGQNHSIVYRLNNQRTEKSLATQPSLAEIPLSGKWQFQLAPHALDNRWSASLESDTLQLLVMKFQVERLPNEGSAIKWSAADFDDSGWKTIKVSDEFNPKTGVQRYLSGWDAWWISYYDYSSHLQAIEGGNRTFRKEIVLESSVKAAQLAITGDQTYELSINSKVVAKDADWKVAEVFDLSAYLKTGTNLFEVKTTNTRGLLLQGSILLKNGKKLSIRSDSTWLVSAGNADWKPAFQFASPPLGNWGKIDNPLQKLKYPTVVWYRQQIPPGINAMLPPSINGKYSVFLNGKLLKIEGTEQPIEFKNLNPSGKNQIAIRVEITLETDGLTKPLEMICGKTECELAPWNSMGLHWYSGRAVYSKTVQISPNYLDQETRLMLDLGTVNYFAEVWVNGKLVTFFPWPPFQADITPFVKPGENEITLVVSNLLANKASWNILDANIPNRDARWWHDGSLMREKEKLTSGLLGPVKIISQHKESVTIQLR